MVDYITAEVKSYIGKESQWVECTDEVEKGQIRRHFQAIMDPDPCYWDEAYAKKTKFGGIVAPPLFPLHALRPVPSNPDPFEGTHLDPDFDGSKRGPVLGLDHPPIPLVRILNGGNQVELYQQAKPGERIFFKSKYVDVFQKDGRTGTMVFLLTETVYKNDKDEILMKGVQTKIMR
jgi:acyl dehydratase